MKRPKLAALAVVLVLIGAGSAFAAYIILSNTYDYDVTVEGEYITITEVSAPSGTLAKGTNYTYRITATVNSGSWDASLWFNITSSAIEDNTHLSDYIIYVNGTGLTRMHNQAIPNRYQSQYLIGTFSEGQTLTFDWTINFDYGWPSGTFNILLYIDGQAN
ncbi:MAG: hypothetical protein GF411_12425 [Candidatus Lokiarchaeota archaeon]|nr:hypothetical protein [Candidatus Lokiarchaeota archaeon]